MTLYQKKKAGEFERVKVNKISNGKIKAVLFESSSKIADEKFFFS